MILIVKVNVNSYLSTEEPNQIEDKIFTYVMHSAYSLELSEKIELQKIWCRKNFKL